jgi:outer membrane protein assembly factor BamB
MWSCITRTSAVRVLLPTALLAAGAILAQTAAADPHTFRKGHQNATLYAVGQGGEVLLAIDVVEKRTTVVGPTRFPFNCCPPLAIGQHGKTAFTIANSADSNRAQLARINLRTGAGNLVGGPLGQDLFIMGMAVAPDGVLYAVGDVRANSPTFNSLYTINRRTGRATRVGALGISSPACDIGDLCFSRFVMSLSFDSRGTMYGATTTALYTIDRRTGAATKVADFKGSSAVMGISFARDDTLYAADYVPLPVGSTIYKVNLKAGDKKGDLTSLLKTGIGLVHNIAFAPVRADCKGSHSYLSHTDRCEEHD